MASVTVLHHALNVGVYDRDKLHRVDIDRFRLAAERQTNFIGDAVGRASPRPGFEHIDDLPGDTRPIPFLAGGDNAAMILLSDAEMRVFDRATNEIVTRQAVTAAVTGLGPTSTAAGQSSVIGPGTRVTMSARAHGVRAWALIGVTIGAGEENIEHGIHITVERGPVEAKIVNTAGVLFKASLLRGQYSLGITPNDTSLLIKFSSDLTQQVIIDSVTIEAAGEMVLPTLWPTADLDKINIAQSLDVMFVACDGHHEQRIERYGDRSWAVVNYDRADGPFMPDRQALVTLKPSVLNGNGTLTASEDYFVQGHVGALFRLFHEGQRIDEYLAGENSRTSAFLVTGITESNFEERKFTIQVSGTWSGTVRTRRSLSGEFGSYMDMRRAQSSAITDIDANATYTNDDNEDNIEEWVRAEFPAGLYTSGEARIRFTYGGGGGYGICRVIGYTSPTEVAIEVLEPFKGTGAVETWQQSRWDGHNGYPSAVGFVDGRLAWSGNDKFDASISDAFMSFDADFEGDAGPLSRSIALGGRNEVRWMLPLSTILIGCDSRVVTARASSLEEVLTPDNFGMKSIANIGAAPVSPVELGDDRALFVQGAGNRIFEITWSGERGNYIAAPFSKLTADLFTSGVKSLAHQTLPDQRVWVTTETDDAVCIVYEPTQGVLAAHFPISTSADTDIFRRFAVLPGTDQDQVYAVIKRVVNGSTVYHFEVMAKDSEALIGTVCKVMDGHVSGTGAHSATITGLDHLEGRTVVAWVDGAPVTDSTITDPATSNTKTFVVTGGQIVLPTAPTSGWCVGLPYTWQYKSARLAYGVQGYTPMLANKSLSAIGLLLSDYCRSGVRYGVSRGSGFEADWSLPNLHGATSDVAPEVVAGPDEDEHPFPAGSPIDLDVRVCLEGQSPKPFSVRSLVLAIETHG